MSVRSPFTAAGALGLALALSACTPEVQSQGDSAQPAPETVTVTQTAPAPGAPEQEEPTQTGSGDDEASDAESAQQDDSNQDSEKAPAASSGELTERGNIPKQIGEEASLAASSGEKALEFTVTDIQPGFQCTGQFAEAPENEAFVKVDITGSTGSAADMEELFYSDSMMFNPYDWKFVDSSGQTANDIGTIATYSCLDSSETLPMDIGPGENVSGSLVLDVTDESGTLIYEPVYDSAGWEWSI